MLAFVPGMRAAKFGRIVNISSRAIMGKSYRTVYASAKAGILGMTRALAKELGPTILVNAICPGLIQTETPKNPVIIERGAQIAQAGVALRRIGQTDDVAQLVLFLATSEPCYITGQDFKVDGFQYNM